MARIASVVVSQNQTSVGITTPTKVRRRARIRRLQRGGGSNVIVGFALTSVIFILIGSICPIEGSPRSVCLRNCHLCQQMYGEHFEGHRCAHTCVRLRGRVIPDCTDLVSIGPYLDPTATSKTS